jgi:FKBP-type peptidyl-prolyl cis-trans isomerase (trigger factor)
MADHYKTCDIHEKAFPNNQIDTRKTKMVKLYVEEMQEIAGKQVKMNLFVDKQASEEGIDVCAQCLQEKVLALLTATDNTPAWKAVKWLTETAYKKDGTPYERNIKHVFTAEEIEEQIKAEKAQPVAPKAK